MKKRFVFLAALTLSATLLLPACGGSEGVLLDYGVGMAEDGSYNREMYYANQQSPNGADPGAIYVPEEQDPVYGGYYYMYITGQSADNNKTYAFNCTRSKDLINWELAGVYNGYAVEVEGADWQRTDFWAPDIEYNAEDGLYYMYFSADAKDNANANPYNFEEGDRKSLAIAVGESPVDFHMIGRDYNVHDYYGNLIRRERPHVDFNVGLDLPGKYGSALNFDIIDPDLFVDDDGSIYLYFCKEADGNNGLFPRGIWGVKMLDYLTPDYTTLTFICEPNKMSTTGGYAHYMEMKETYDADTSVPKVAPEPVWYESTGKTYDFNEGGVNEGPYMVKHGGKYYMTYSGNGYGSPHYSVHQAISETPLGKFTKPQFGEGNPILDSTGSTMAGTAHHCFVPAGDELMIMYHRHANPVKYSDGWNGRMISIDRTRFVYRDGQGWLLASNGPTYNTLQWKPESIGGYKNHAKNATVTASNGTGVHYLNDEFIPNAFFVQDMQYYSDGETEITLTWDTPVSVEGIMVYNCNDEMYAFSKVAEIKFYFAEKPAWAESNYSYGVIQDLLFPEKYVSQSAGTIVYNTAAVADFAEIKVNKITVTIRDKFETEDALGEPVPSIGVSEIVVLGK